MGSDESCFQGPAGEIVVSRSDLARCVRRLRDMVLHCAERGLDGIGVGRLVADANDRILCSAASMAEAELGPPPCGYSLMVLGSEGRREQLLATDQDNALVFDVPDDPAAAYFESLGRLFLSTLIEAGVPPCPHGVTVDNPVWRRSAAAWRDGVSAMTRMVDADAVLHLTQLADARHVHGEARLFENLREHVMRQIGDTPVLLMYMAREALRFPPPLGFFNSLVVERHGSAKGALDVKKGGVFTLTQGIKTLALEHGLRETGTLERLRALRGEGVFSEGMATGMEDALRLFQALRLHAQAVAVRAGMPPDNFIRPDSLSVVEREKLINCFKFVAEFQSFLHAKYGLHLIS